MFDSCASNSTVSAFLYEEVARSIASGAVAPPVVEWCSETTSHRFTDVRSPPARVAVLCTAWADVCLWCECGVRGGCSCSFPMRRRGPTCGSAMCSGAA